MTTNPTATRCGRGRLDRRATLAAAIMALSGCDFRPPPSDGGSSGVFNNTNDPTNQNASYIGSAACSACHPGVTEQHALHGHAHQLTPIQGPPPVFPAEAVNAGVPNPPEGFEWADVAYVIGGYTKKAQFVGTDGFLLSTGADGVDTQWNLAFPANGTASGFVPSDADALTPPPYDHSCFTCHTTGPRPQTPDAPLFQENRPGMAGTFHEAGVQCEACHGPGSNHAPNPAARDLYVNAGADQCGTCHTRGNDPAVILAADGYIERYEQWPELLASGGHSSFNCTFCHDPHVSVTYDRPNAIRNECRDCHADTNMAFHEDVVFVRGDYTEAVSCESCHMPFATRSATTAGEDVVGPLGRMGDTRTHIFRISTEAQGYQQFFTDDGSAVRKDDDGRAALTVDFVCLRCHNGIGNAFEVTSLETAANVAFGVHQLPQ